MPSSESTIPIPFYQLPQLSAGEKVLLIGNLAAKADELQSLRSGVLEKVAEKGGMVGFEQLDRLEQSEYRGDCTNKI
jgi:hypothetical protein